MRNRWPRTVLSGDDRPDQGNASADARAVFRFGTAFRSRSFAPYDENSRTTLPNVPVDSSAA